MPIDGQWKLFAAFGCDAAHMPCRGSGSVKALPSQQLSTPGQVCVLAIGEELLVEKFSIDGDVFHHFGAIERCRPGGSKNKFRRFKLSLIQLFRAPIQVTEIAP